MDKPVGSGNSGLTRQGNSTETWYDSGNSEEEETATFRRLTEPLNLIPMQWMWIRSISLLVKEQSTSETESASFATRKDATHPNTKDILGKEEGGNLLETNPPGGGQWRLPKRSKPTPKLPTS